MAPLVASAPVAAAPVSPTPAPTVPPASNPAPPAEGDLSSQLAALTPLSVPEWFSSKVASAIADGRRLATEFANTHAPGEKWLASQWALLNLGFPPKSDDEDLKLLHELQDSRTDAGVATAQFWAKHGLQDEWLHMLQDYTRGAAPAQARAATKLLNDTLSMVNQATQIAKSSMLRQRPFAVDETLKLAVDKPGNNPSFPSGHTSLAYAACIVLAHLMPDRADEFMNYAAQASFARPYAGVHFPTDVYAGAKLATSIAAYMVATSHVTQRRGTKRAAAVAPAHGAQHAALAGAVTLAGTPLQRVA